MNYPESMETKADRWPPGAVGAEEQWLMGPGFPFGGDEMFESQIRVMFVQHYDCSKCHPIVHCNMIDFIFVTSTSIFFKIYVRGLAAAWHPQLRPGVGSHLPQWWPQSHL